jgi:alpha-1,2-mannosyltransferase
VSAAAASTPRGIRRAGEDRRDRRRFPRPAREHLALALFLTSTLVWWLVFRNTPQVDLAVYREAGEVWLRGDPLYGPGFGDDLDRKLPFTYPPFAALLMAPLVMLPFAVLGVVWTAVSVAALLYLVASVAPAAGDGRNRRAFVLAAAGLLLWTAPVTDTLTFGQVSLLLATLCVVDVTRARPYQGVLVGVACAVKLVPGLFIVYFLVTGRLRAFAVSAGTFAASTLLAWAVLPADSWAYWTTVVWDSGRIGDSTHPSNQSLRGALLRLLPTSVPGVAAALACIVVAAFGLWWARRASKAGDEGLGALLVGLTALLVSPISWVHHAVWAPLTLAAVVRPGLADRRYRWGLAAGALLLLVPLPNLLVKDFARDLDAAVTALGQNSYVLLYLVLLLAVRVRVSSSGSSSTGFGTAPPYRRSREA